jgi:hypothetical protein
LHRAPIDPPCDSHRAGNPALRYGSRAALPPPKRRTAADGVDDGPLSKRHATSAGAAAGLVGVLALVALMSSAVIRGDSRAGEAALPTRPSGLHWSGRELVTSAPFGGVTGGSVWSPGWVGASPSVGAHGGVTACHTDACCAARPLDCGVAEVPQLVLFGGRVRNHPETISGWLNNPETGRDVDAEPPLSNDMWVLRPGVAAMGGTPIVGHFGAINLAANVSDPSGLPAKLGIPLISTLAMSMAKPRGSTVDASGQSWPLWPAPREEAQTWGTDDAFYLFGGHGKYGDMQDLWRFSRAKSEWDFMWSGGLPMGVDAQLDPTAVSQDQWELLLCWLDPAEVRRAPPLCLRQRRSWPFMTVCDVMPWLRLHLWGQGLIWDPETGWPVASPYPVSSWPYRRALTPDVVKPVNQPTSAAANQPKA